ncbi:MAG: cation:proton antiporter [Lysobacterales bacterium]
MDDVIVRNPYALSLAVLGIVLLGAAWLPHRLKRHVLSFPIVYVGLGFVLYALPWTLPLPHPDPFLAPVLTEKLTELVVLVALMSVGLRIDTPFGWRRWHVTWRLLAIAMPLAIALGIALAYWLGGFVLATAVLMGAVLAPTDPVLAGDIQVGAPHEGGEDPVRMALSTEAGFNDGLAFPFVWAAIAMSTTLVPGFDWLETWWWRDLVLRTVVGIGLGWALGWAGMWFLFRQSSPERPAAMGDGAASLAITLAVYGITELVGGYGFLAVFVAALAIRHYERDHAYHKSLEEFASQCERLLVAVLLVLLGGAYAHGLLSQLTLGGAAFAVLFVFGVRPLTAWLSLAGTSLTTRERLAISVFGVRGIGSIYYVAFAINHAEIVQARELWATVGLVVLLSIVVHGLTATPVMRFLDSTRRA